MYEDNNNAGWVYEPKFINEQQWQITKLSYMDGITYSSTPSLNIS